MTNSYCQMCSGYAGEHSQILPMCVRTTQRGFTLLELLVVISLLGLLALATTALVDNVDEQQRFETTRTRLQQIRHAIVGNSARTLNGEPEISGFAADMGRLPANIEELVELPSGLEWAALDIIHTGTTASGVVGQLYGGWRGPYLDVMPSSGASAVLAFRDGWGNPDVSAPDADFGWDVTLSGVAPNHTAIAVQSLGADGAPGGTSVYEVDYPAAGRLVTERDWKVDFSGVSPAFKITIKGTPVVAASNLRLYVYYIKDGQVSITADAFASTSFSAVAGVASQVFEEDYASGGQVLPIGRLAAIVACPDGTIYDGNCPGANPTLLNPYYFTILPRAFANPVTIEWNID